MANKKIAMCRQLRSGLQRAERFASGVSPVETAEDKLQGIKVKNDAWLSLRRVYPSLKEEKHLLAVEHWC